jgi:succinyl-diaminopimelate desuccinylase
MKKSNLNLRKIINSHKKEIVKLTQDLVAIPSVDGLETKVCQLIEKKLGKYGIKGQYFGENKNRLNFIAKLRGKNRSRILLFNGHTDVVPPGDESKWKYPPFSARLVDRKIYGRGASDMKGGLASLVLTAIFLKESQLDLDGDVVFAFTANEENPQKGGIGACYLLENALLKGDACIIAEPKTDYIDIGSRGVYRLAITTLGKTWHTGRIRNEGSNAVLKMAKVLLALDKYQLKYKFHKYFPSPKISVGTVISGGTAINVVPDECQALVDIRLSYGQTKESVKKDLKLFFQKVKKQDKELKIKIEEILYVPPAVIDAKEEIVTLLQKNAQKVLKFKPRLKVSGPMSDNNFMISAGIPTVNFGPNGENFHSENEFVEVDSIFQVAEIFTQTAIDYFK